MDCQKPPELSSEEQTTLKHLGDLLQLFHHRNNNQHRRSIWWRHFSTFRRQLTQLNQDITQLNTIPTTHLEKARKKARDPQTRLKIEQRLAFWERTLVAKWQHAFSQLVADGRFAMLGLVLMAVLSEICRVAGLTAKLEDLGQLEVQKALEAFAKEGWENDENGPSRSTLRVEEDFGEVIGRDPETTLDEKPDIAHSYQQSLVKTSAQGTKANEEPLNHILEASPPPTRNEQPPKRTNNSLESSMKKKKKRKKGNAIDDLFSGF
ncbi:ribonuclease MRP protein subunit rmp1-like protein [Acrodontium crateriforme]|uniref:Ribonuclease MRP protein subunit rmp1-like protein n=1 Tax=Acrodontium crateriforme TaxID=150365 RepID=A0AAQ3M3V5_9PEZI|nr:ribonuclease MRP protein subunit rmp1-like protein [Acrodontium crateriforme]